MVSANVDGKMSIALPKEWAPLTIRPDLNQAVRKAIGSSKISTWLLLYFREYTEACDEKHNPREIIFIMRSMYALQLHRPKQLALAMQAQSFMQTWVVPKKCFKKKLDLMKNWASLVTKKQWRMKETKECRH